MCLNPFQVSQTFVKQKKKTKKQLQRQKLTSTSTKKFFSQIIQDL